MTKFAKLLLTVIIGATLASCTSSFSYGFNIETGDFINVKLDTSDGHKLTQDGGTFTISYEDKVISGGGFQLPDVSKLLLETVSTTEGVTVLEESLDTEPAYVFYEYTYEDGTLEWNYIIRSKNSEAGVAIANRTSANSAKEIFDLITFEFNEN